MAHNYLTVFLYFMLLIGYSISILISLFEKSFKIITLLTN